MKNPILIARAAPEVNGVYRNKNSGSIMVLKNMKLKGFIDGETEKPYNGYKGKIWHEMHGWINSCIITPETLLEEYTLLVST